jgi:hypothetical protein
MHTRPVRQGAGRAVTEPVLAPLDWGSAPARGRGVALLRALRRLHRVGGGAATLVETGTLRDERVEAATGDGWSTLVWAWYAQQTGGLVYTVDVDERNLNSPARHV